MKATTNVDIDVSRIVVILVAVGVVGGLGYLGYSTIKGAKESNIHSGAAEDGYDSTDSIAVRLKNALEINPVILDFNVDEEQTLDALKQIKTPKQLKAVVSAYKTLTNNRLFDDLQRVGSDDYVLVEKELKRIG